MAVVVCLSTFLGIGTTTAFAAAERQEVYMVAFPRDGDANYGGEWGHENKNLMNGWHTGSSNYTTIRAMGSYTGNICYCIEPGVVQNTGDTFTKWDENFWNNYPSSYNHTIEPDEIKAFIAVFFSTVIPEPFPQAGAVRMKAAISWLMRLPHSISFGKR